MWEGKQSNSIVMLEIFPIFLWDVFSSTRWNDHAFIVLKKGGTNHQPSIHFILQSDQDEKSVADDLWKKLLLWQTIVRTYFLQSKL